VMRSWVVLPTGLIRDGIRDDAYVLEFFFSCGSWIGRPN
jgi:hypothetical protein